MTYIFAVRKGGAIAQSVEQWTENPCVPVPIAIGTIPGDEKSIIVTFNNLRCRYSVIYFIVKLLTDITLGLHLILMRDLLHNTGYFGGKSYTFKATDWVIFLLIPCESIEQAIFVETRIKKMKSRKYIENLLKYPEMINKLRNDFIK